MVYCYIPNGVNILEWVPKDAGAKYTLVASDVGWDFGEPMGSNGVGDHCGVEIFGGADHDAGGVGVPGVELTDPRPAARIP